VRPIAGMKTQQAVITAIKKVLDKGDIECPAFSRERLPFLPSLVPVRPPIVQADS
jgi:hypothetical protein